MKTATFLLSALFSSWAAAAQDRFAFTGTIQDVLSLVDAHSFEYPVASGWSKRGTFEVGQKLTGAFYFNPELLTAINTGDSTSVAYSSLNPIYYYVDGGFGYTNEYSFSPGNNLISFTANEESAFIQLKSTSRFLSNLEVSTIKFSAAAGTSIEGLKTLSDLNSFAGTISYRWYAQDGRIGTNSFLASIDSITLVPELPIWATLLTGLALCGALTFRGSRNV